MAPKPKAVKKDKKEKDTKSEADVKRQKQANMITQLKDSEEKKKKVDSGLIEVDESEKEKLDARVSFLAKYRGCDKGEQKLKMLEWKPLKMTRPARVGTHPSPGQWLTPRWTRKR